jgi:hypothetical protein
MLDRLPHRGHREGVARARLDEREHLRVDHRHAAGIDVDVNDAFAEQRADIGRGGPRPEQQEQQRQPEAAERRQNATRLRTSSA